MCRKRKKSKSKGVIRTERKGPVRRCGTLADKSTPTQQERIPNLPHAKSIDSQHTLTTPRQNSTFWKRRSRGAPETSGTSALHETAVEAMFGRRAHRAKQDQHVERCVLSAQAYEMDFQEQQESDNSSRPGNSDGILKRRLQRLPRREKRDIRRPDIEYTVPGYEGRQLNLASHPDGVMIGPALTTSESSSRTVRSRQGNCNRERWLVH